MARTPWDHGKTNTERGLGWAWRKQRARILRRDQHLCQDCKAKGRITPATECHHTIPRAKAGPSLAKDEDVTSLCSECHRARDAEARGHTSKPRLAFDASGRVVW